MERIRYLDEIRLQINLVRDKNMNFLDTLIYNLNQRKESNENQGSQKNETEGSQKNETEGSQKNFY